MDAAQLAQAIDAIGTLAEDAGGSLDKKPNVADVEALTGFDMTGADRDEAWAAYQGQQEAAGGADEDKGDEDAPEPAKAPERPARGATRVTNRHASPLAIGGVTIRAGESADVPGFDANHAVLKRWLDAGVIEAG